MEEFLSNEQFIQYRLQQTEDIRGLNERVLDVERSSLKTREKVYLAVLFFLLGSLSSGFVRIAGVVVRAPKRLLGERRHQSGEKRHQIDFFKNIVL